MPKTNSKKNDSEYIRCFSCGASTFNMDGPTHRYMLSSPGCWAMAGEVWAREYLNVLYGKSHHLTVDSYACQHPGEPVPPSINSVDLHLCSLYMTFEKGLNPLESAQFKQELAQLNKRENFFSWLVPPEDFGAVTVTDVWEAENPQEHHRLAMEWAHSVWKAWVDHHDTIKKWIDR